ncbi:phosphoribosyltransferase-like protein [Coniochaeta sp. 2T2.1]|nr:phosphoribosyltransferase-like protein [Coniochaeta sp. 2T2.1]
MVKNIVVLGGNSHPELVERICASLGLTPCSRILTKFSGGETRCEVQDSVRGKDVYIIQTGAGKVNDVLMDLLIMISALKTGSARRVTAVLPLFPYSRQPDVPYKKAGAPMSRVGPDFSVPPTPGPGIARTAGLDNGTDMSGLMSKVSLNPDLSSPVKKSAPNGVNGGSQGRPGTSGPGSPLTRTFTTHNYENPALVSTFQAKPGYKQWVAQAGTLVADLLTCAGADHIVRLSRLRKDILSSELLDLHDSQYQGFFDVPVDNLYAKGLLQRYITLNIPNYKDAVIVSPDAGGAKRASAIADSLGLSFSLIHKERRPTKITDRQSASMILVGDVSDRVCILIDDLIDTGNTIVRAAKLLKKEGATHVYALVTHGVLSGDAPDRIKYSCIDKLVTTNSVPQDDNKAQLCGRLDVLDISQVIAEAIRRSHHGESLSALFAYN